MDQDAAAQPNMCYCQIAPLAGGADGKTPTASCTGFVMRPDGTLLDLGGVYQFTVALPFAYGESVGSLAAQLVAAVAAGYSMPGLAAQVEFVPFV